MSKTLVWAHRGASGTMPENTMPSFEKAVKMGADGLELDIQLTKDDKIVVCHDEKIDRTSNGKGYLKDYTFAELRKFSFDNGMKSFAGTKIPTIEEVFDLIKDTEMTVNIELKTSKFAYDGIEEKILETVEKYGLNDRIIYSCFNHYTIKKIQELNPAARTAFLISDGFVEMPAYAAKHKVEALHPSKYILQLPDFMEECEKEGVKVNAWTINREEDLRMCIDAGVNAVITNYPDRAKRIIENRPAPVKKKKKGFWSFLKKK